MVVENMLILLIAAAAWIVCIVPIYAFIRYTNKRETDEERMSAGMTIAVSVLIALFPAGVLAAMLLAVMGSVHTLGLLFDIDLSGGGILLLAVAIFVYLFTLDSVVAAVLGAVAGDGVVQTLLLLAVRSLAVFSICRLFEVGERGSLILGVGVAAIIWAFEWLIETKEKREAVKE